jgi:hypothetical protein
MKSKSLNHSNPYLKNEAKAKKLLLRSIASSTAIETGDSISSIEAKLSQQCSAANRVKLA